MKRDRFLTPGMLVLFIGFGLGAFWPEITALWRIATDGQPVCGGLLAFGMVVTGVGIGLVIIHEFAMRQ